MWELAKVVAQKGPASLALLVALVSVVVVGLALVVLLKLAGS